MSDEVLNKLSTVDIATLVALIILLNFIVNLITPWFTKLSNHIISRYKKTESEKSLQTRVKEDHETLRKHEEVFKKEHSALVSAVEKLQHTMNEHIEKDEKRYLEDQKRLNKRLRAELKDKISIRYRTHSKCGKWTLMDKEALEDLIQEYEDAGGENSFVHTVVQKKMYTWEIVEESDL